MSTPNKNIIKHLLSNSGKLKDKETWVSLAEMYGIQPADKERANEDTSYRKKAIGRQAQRYWQSYVKQQQKLKLTKQIFDGKGNLKFETFKKTPQPIQKYDEEKFEIQAITTNPHGGAWMKLKRKEGFQNEEHFETLKNILIKEIVPSNYTEAPDDFVKKGCMVYTSDKHIGALTKEDSVYKNKYDKEEMRRRIVTIPLDEIKRKVDLHGFFESLFIMDLGDALDGFNQKTTGGLRGTSSHILPQQMNNREQHDYYVELHKELFDTIVKEGYAANIYFVATSNSNHGGDFEYGAMRHLETYLNVKYPFINTVVNYKPFNHFTYGNHAIIFGHGKDDEDMKHGLPLNLNEKVENYLNDYIEKNKLSNYHVTVVTGDLHQSSINYGKRFRYVKVLSQYGSSKWMHTNFGSGSPGLSIEVFEKKQNRIDKSDVFFNIENESNTGIEF